MIQKAVGSAVEVSRTAPDFYLNEDEPGLLVVGGRFLRTELDAWAVVANAAKGSWCRIGASNSIGGEERLVSDQLDGLVGEPLRITIGSPTFVGAKHFFTVEGLRGLLSRPEKLAGVSVVRVAEDFTTFRCGDITFEPWAGPPEAAPQRQEVSADKSPRRYIRTLTSSPVVPLETDPWLLSGPLPEPSRVFGVWRDASTSWLCRTLVNEVFDDGGRIHVVIHGPPTRRLELGREGPLGIRQYQSIAEAAQWVFREGTDIEVRHTLLTSEIARNWGALLTYFDRIFQVIDPSLEGARISYAAHLRGGSRETIRMLSDLRRTLFDEIQRVTQQTRDLAASLWKDVLLAVGAVGFRAVLDLVKGGPSLARIYAIVLISTAIYLVASFIVTTNLNRKFLRIAEDSRREWRSKLYNFLTDEDFQSLTDKPLNDLISAYRRVVLWGWIVTLIAVVILTYLAANTISEDILHLWSKVTSAISWRAS